MSIVILLFLLYLQFFACNIYGANHVCYFFFIIYDSYYCYRRLLTCIAES